MEAPLYLIAAALWAIAAAFTHREGLFLLNCVASFLATFLVGWAIGIIVRGRE